MESMEGKSKQTDQPRVFQTTHWSVVVNANREDSVLAKEALEKLCSVYWSPLYYFLLRKGIKSHDAQDLVQGFFERLLSKDGLKTVDPARGKFRTFLLKSITHYMQNEWKKDQALKRGGGMVWLSFDALDSDQLVAPDAVARASSAELKYDQAWAELMVKQVHQRLQQEYDKLGMSDRYAVLKSHLLQNPRDEGYYPSAAAKLGLTESGMRSAMFRFRKRFAELFRQEIVQTVSDESGVDDEIRYLIQMVQT